MSSQPQSEQRRSWKSAKSPPSLATLVFIAGLSVVAMNIFIPVMPMLGQDLGVSDATAQYVLTLFLATTAISQLFLGPLADRFGRRPVLLVCIAIFVLSSLICVFATSIEMLLIGRVIQAATAATMTLSRAIVRDLYSRERAASMIGYVTMAMAVMPMIAPTIGGWVGEIYGWRAPFAILVVGGIALFILIWFDLGETHTPREESWGDQLRDYLSLLREPEIWGYFLCATAASGAYFAFLGGAPFVGQNIVGMTPSALGLYFALVAIGYIAGNFIAGRYSSRIGIEPMMLYGGLVACVGVSLALCLMTSFPPHAFYLFGPMLFVGLGNGMVLPNAGAGAVSVRPDLAGSASGLAGFVQLGGGAALAVLSGNLITVENQAIPLYAIMFITSFVGALVAYWMYVRARRAGQKGFAGE